MRPLPTVSLALVLLAAALSGCLGGDEPAPQPAATNETLEGGIDPNMTVDDGTGEMAADLGHMPHLHDYWQGKERVTLMDEDVTIDQFNALGFTFFNTFRGTPGVGGTFLELPDGAIVYEGTGELEFTVSWTDATVTGAAVSYRTPATPDFTEPQALTQGTPLVIAVTPDMCDMPHEKDSRWAFVLMPAQAGQSMVGKLHVKVDIVRMRDITAFPGHPELFQGAHTLTLYDGPAQSSTNNFATIIAGFATQNRQDSSIVSERVVPMETMSMVANVTITSATSNVGTVSNVSFLYKPADSSFRFFRAQTLAADKESGVYQFAWPVEMRQTDSPYAKQSQWRFDLLIQTDPAGQGWETNGLATAQVDYTLQVVAYDSLLEGIEPVPEDDD